TRDGSLLDHLVGEREQPVRNLEAERFGGLEVEHQLELGRLHDRQVRWFFALENSSHIDPALAIPVRKTRTVAEQAARGDKFLLEIDHWNGVACRKRDELIPSCAIERVVTNDQSTNLLLLEGQKGRIDFGCRARGEHDRFHAESFRGCLKILRLSL